jgi:hypothetical protein
MNNPKSRKRTLIFATIAVLLVAILAVGGWFGYRKYKKASTTTEEGVPPASSVDKTDSELENGQGRAVDPGVAPNQQDPSKQTSSSGVPVPGLSKSAGNVSAAPKNVMIDFVCTAPAGGYQCQLVLTPKSGQPQPNFAKQSMQADRSGTNGAIWNWQTVSGKWEVRAVLYNSSGASNSSPSQSFEVQ